MTAKQFRKFLDNNELSVRQAARELGVHERTLHRYLSGNAPIPKLVELALRTVAQDHSDARGTAGAGVRK
jgi:plasmid maintenance system antidote protein VapI